MAANDTLLYLIYDDLVGSVSGIGQKTFLDRPKITTDKFTSFIVVDLPIEIRGMLKGSVDVLSDCYGAFSVYCKAKTDSTINIGVQSELVQNVLDLFPINGTHITATRPRVIMQGEDGYGYQVTKIVFSLRTKLNARKI